MSEVAQRGIRHDCLVSLQAQPALVKRLAEFRIAVIGGTGFVGTWIAETVAALNDELGMRVRVDLLGRSATAWNKAHPHLSSRSDVKTVAVDVLSPFELPHDVTHVLYAAGVADPKVHASDPLRVHKTTLHGLAHALTASERLELLQRFVNLSSGLVAGVFALENGLREDDLGLLDFTRPHNIYAEARRAGESLVSLYASQYRIPISTARAFTFLGPYQPLDAPWAANNFLRDALSGNNIRIHGDGATRRSYLYGSDVASWLLKILVDGKDGMVYNLGGTQAVSHADIARLVAKSVLPEPQLIYKSQPAVVGRRQDFFPDLSHVHATLGLQQTIETDAAVQRTLRWHAGRMGIVRLLRQEVNVF